MASSSLTQGFELRELPPHDKDFKYVAKKVMDSSGGVAFNIQKIYKIINSTTWKNYCETRAQIFDQTGRKCFVGERHLFHGSPHAADIAEKGFLMAKSRSAGIFFSDQSAVSNVYARGPAKKMLLCRVAFYVPNATMPAEFRTENISARIFIIHNEKQAYPGFLIEYT